jgi:hypothetical protein
MLITIAERDILRAAGAEDELTDSFWMCE